MAKLVICSFEASFPQSLPVCDEEDDSSRENFFLIPAGDALASAPPKKNRVLMSYAMQGSPRSLYVHVPFCESKCHYCAFNSLAGVSEAEMTSYVEALLRELDSLGENRPLDLETVYVGGGTPTTLPAAALERLLSGIQSRLGPMPPDEWTVEVNPGTLTSERLRAFAAGGVNRVSVGAQSLDSKWLRLLGRGHRPGDVRETVAAVRRQGIQDINLDLIYALPGQSLSEWRSDLEKALELEPQHLSLYALQYEEGTPFGLARERGKVRELCEDLQRDMFSLATQLLREQGIEFYEISNFAREGKQSKHNLTYWRNEPYYGVGAGSYSRVGGERRRNCLDFREYIQCLRQGESPVDQKDTLGPWEDYLETLIAGLRTREGVNLDTLGRRTGRDPRREHQRHLEFLIEKGLATRDMDRLRLTEDGLWVLDSVLEPFLEDRRIAGEAVASLR